MGEKHAVEMALTVLVSFQTSLPYNSFMISRDSLTAVALLSLSIENMKFWWGSWGKEEEEKGVKLANVKGYLKTTSY